MQQREEADSGRQRVGEGAQAAGDKPPKKLPRGKGGAKAPPTGGATTLPVLPIRKQSRITSDVNVKAKSGGRRRRKNVLYLYKKISLN